MRLLPARRETPAAPEAEAEAHPPAPVPAEPAPDSRYREVVRRLAEAASTGHRERVPF